MSTGCSARPWYAGRTPPSEEVLSIFEDAGKPEILYNQANPETIEGEFATLMRGIYGKMDSLKRSPDDFRTLAEEDGYVMREQNPELPPVCCHIVATSFERYLKDDLLGVAVEDFFFSWPPMSEDEEAERLEEQLQQEMREAETMFAEEEAPDDLDDDIGALPMSADSVAPKKKLKKKIAKKKEG